MNTFAERLLELMAGKNINASRLSEITTVTESSLSRILKNETRSPKINFLARIVDSFHLNPYNLYHLLMGEVYTEKPSGSVTAENEYLKKRVAELEEHEAFLKNECRVKNMQIEASYIHMKSMERRLERIGIGAGKPSLPHHTKRKELIINGDLSPEPVLVPGD